MESWAVKIIFFIYFHFRYTIFWPLSILHPPFSQLHLYPFFLDVPLYLLAEITHPEQPPTLRKASVMKFAPCLSSTASPHNQDPWCFLLIELGSGSSSKCRLDCLFQSLIDYRQFPFNYDILTTYCDCSRRRVRCKNYTR